MNESPDTKTPMSVVLIDGTKTNAIIPRPKMGDIVLAEPRDAVTLGHMRRAARRVQRHRGPTDVALRRAQDVALRRAQDVALRQAQDVALRQAQDVDVQTI
jgi:hypothetical protein